MFISQTLDEHKKATTSWRQPLHRCGKPESTHVLRFLQAWAICRTDDWFWCLCACTCARTSQGFACTKLYTTRGFSCTKLYAPRCRNYEHNVYHMDLAIWSPTIQLGKYPTFVESLALEPLSLLVRESESFNARFDAMSSLVAEYARFDGFNGVASIGILKESCPMVIPSFWATMAFQACSLNVKPV